MRLQGFPGAALVAGAGLILALTALLTASHNPEDLPSFRLRVEVPDNHASLLSTLWEAPRCGRG